MSVEHSLFFGTWSLYEIIAGPLAWLSFLILAGGVCFRILQFFALSRKKERLRYQPVKAYYHSRAVSPAMNPGVRVGLAVRSSIFGACLDTGVVTTLMHILLFLIPLSVSAHSLLVHESWGFQPLSLPEAASDVLTMVFLGCAVLLLTRRLLVARVRGISTSADYALWLITAAPFATGLIAHHHWFDYRTMLMLHILSAELMLIAVACTRLGHMVFVVLARCFISSEYSFGRPSREW